MKQVSAKTKLKGIIFDFGGVISHTPSPGIMDRMCRIAGVEPEAIKPEYIRLRGEFDRGTLSGVEYWRRVAASVGVTPPETALHQLVDEDVRSWTHINEETLAFMKDIRPKVFRMGLLSNMTFDCLHYVEEHFQWLEWFDTLVFSCNINHIKPEREIYDYCIRAMGLPAEECLFIDDNEANVAAARAAGLHALQFQSFPLFRRDFEADYDIEGSGRLADPMARVIEKHGKTLEKLGRD